MARMELDRELIFGMPVFVVGSLVSLGIIGSTVVGIDLGQMLYSTSGIELTYARAMSVAALAYVYLNRDISFGDFGGVDLWVVYATVGMVIAPPLFPAFADTLAQRPAAIIAFLVQTAGFTLVSYVN